MTKKIVKPSASIETTNMNQTLRAYLENQERIVTNLNVFHRMASQQIQASSQMLTAVGAALDQAQAVTKGALSSAGFVEDSPGLEAFSAVHDLLKKERAVLPFVDALTMQVPTAVKPAAVVDGDKKAKKPKKIKDPNAPNRPVTAYFMFSADQRPVVREQMGPYTKPGDIQRQLQDNWNNLPDEEKEVWKNRYRAKWAEHQLELERYNESGGVLSAVDLHPADEDAAEENHDEEEDAAGEDGDGPGIVSEKSDSSSESEEESGEESAPSPTPPPAPKITASAVKATPKPKRTRAIKAAKSPAMELTKVTSPIPSSAEESPEKEKPKKVVKETVAAKRKRVAAENAAAATAAAAEAEAKAATDAAAAEQAASKSQSPEVSRKRKSGKVDTPEVNRKKKAKDTPSMTETEKAARKQKRESQFGTDF